MKSHPALLLVVLRSSSGHVEVVFIGVERWHDPGQVERWQAAETSVLDWADSVREVLQSG
jgi:hypothetical protein